MKADAGMVYLDRGSRCVAVTETGEGLGLLTIKKVEHLENSDCLSSEIAIAASCLDVESLKKRFPEGEPLTVFHFIKSDS